MNEDKSKSEFLGPVHTMIMRVYIEDTDAGGIVYYANYLKFAERARTEMLRASGLSHATMMQEDGLALVVRRCALDCHRPLRLDDSFAVDTAVTSISGALLSLRQHLRREDRSGDTDIATLVVNLACVGRDGRPKRMPLPLRKAMDRFSLSTSKAE